MPVARDHERHPGLAGEPCVRVAQVEPVGLGVDLEERARRQSALDHLLDLDRGRVADVDPPARQVADAIDVRARHRVQHPLGRVLVEARVDGRHHPVELLEDLVGDVELAVRANVHLDPLQDPEGRERLVERVDLLPLQLQPPVAEPRRVVAHREVLVPERLRGARHLLDRRLPVRPGRVRVQVAAQVGALDQDGQRAVASGHQLARVLPQLGWDVGVAEVGVELLLVGGRELLAGLGVRDRVLRDREAPAHRVLAQRDVVVLRAGEVLQQVPVRLGRDDAQVEPEPLVRDHGRLRVALRDDRGDVVPGGEVLDQRGRIRRGRDHVEVAEGLAAAARRARLGDLHRGRMPSQLLDELEQDGQPVAEQAPRLAWVLRLLRERSQDLLLALCAKAREPPQALLLGGRFQLGEGGDSELLPDPARGLRAEPGQAHELHDLFRHERLPLRQRGHLAGLDDLDDLLLDRLADPGQRFRLAFERELRDGTAGLADARRRTPVGEHPEGVLAFELAQVGQQLELVGELVVPRQRRGHRQR